MVSNQFKGIRLDHFGGKSNKLIQQSAAIGDTIRKSGNTRSEPSVAKRQIEDR